MSDVFPHIKPEHNIKCWNGVLLANRGIGLDINLIKTKKLSKSYYHYWTNNGWMSEGLYDWKDFMVDYYIVDATSRNRQVFPTLELAWQYVDSIIKPMLSLNENK